MPERVKAFVLPAAVIVVLEIWARAIHLQSDSLAPPSAIAVALFGGISGWLRPDRHARYAGLGVYRASDRRRHRSCVSALPWAFSMSSTG